MRKKRQAQRGKVDSKRKACGGGGYKARRMNLLVAGGRSRGMETRKCGFRKEYRY